MKKLLIAICAVVLLFAVGYAQQDLIADTGVVMTAQAAKVSLNQTSARMVKGTKIKLKLSGTNETPTWSTSDKTIAVVNAKGKVTAKAKGVAVITATLGKKTYKCRIVVEEPVLNITEITLVSGRTLNLKLSGTKQTVTWSSSNTAVATVTSTGVVSTIASGTVDITATVGKVNFVCKMTVETPKLSQTSLTLEEGNVFKLKVTGTTLAVKWGSTDKTVAKVKNGKVVAISEGKADIVAKVGGKKLVCKVTVKSSDMGDFSVAQMEIYRGNGIVIQTVDSDNEGSSVGVKLLIKNNSELSLSVCVHNSAINGIMYNNNIYSAYIKLPAGKKAYTTFNVEKDWLKKVGINQIESFDFLFWAYDNAKSYKEFETEIVRVKTNHYIDKDVNITGSKIYDKDGVVVDFIKVDKNRLKYCVYNNGSTYFDFDVEDVAINDWAMDTLYNYDISDITVFPGAVAFFEIEIKDSFLKETEIKSISNVEFILEIRINGDYFDSYNTDVIKHSV